MRGLGNGERKEGKVVWGGEGGCGCGCQWPSELVLRGV